MKSMTATNATTIEISPRFTESLPSDESTPRSSRSFTGVSSGFSRTLARSSASVAVMLPPEIWQLPKIGSLMFGGALDLVVQDDGHLVPHVRRGEAAEEARAPRR